MKKVTVIFIASCLLFLPVSLLAAKSDTVTVAVPTDISALTPFKSTTSDLASSSIIFLGLVKMDAVTGEWKPALAESVKLLDDYKRVHIKLKKGLKFQNGDPITAEDVKFTYDLYVGNKSVFARYFKKISKVEVVDKYTAIMHFKKPDVDWMRPVQVMLIAPKKHVEKVGLKKYFKKPMGAGPFKLIRRSIGEEIVFERWEDYPFEKPNFKRLVIKIAPDRIARMAMLETGAVDLIFDLSSLELRRLQKNDGVHVKTAIIPSYFGAGINTHAYPEQLDKYFRQAINYAVNRQEIVDTFFPGMGYPLYTFGSKAEFGYDPNIKFTYDPEKAKALLAKSNYKPGTPIKFAYTSIYPMGSEVFAAVQGYLKEVGIDFQMRMMEHGTFNKLAAKRSPELMIGNTAWPGRRDPTGRLFFGVKSKGFYTVFGGNPEFDKLILQQAGQFDKKKRYQTLNELYRAMHEDPAYLNLFGLKMVYGMSKRIDYVWPNNWNRLDNLDELKLVK